MSSAAEHAWGPVIELLHRVEGQGATPGWALCVRSARRPIFTAQGGQAELRPRPRPVLLEHPWDLASLTKVLATTPLAMAMVAAGRLDLDAPLSELVPRAPAGVTARHCLSHCSGLPAWRPLWQALRGRPWGTSRTRAAVLAEVVDTPLSSEPGTSHVYSDLGFLLLGAALETAGGDRLDRLFEQHVRRPSQVDLRWGWPAAAATEDCPVRGRVIVGEVHDLNAGLMGGIAPHAGLFGSVEAVAAAGAWQLRAWQGEADEGLEPAVVRRFWSERGPGSHYLGWDGVSPQGSSASERWPDDGVGHLGFTGCSLWVAPQQDIVVAFCTNRVHPEIEGGALPGAVAGPRTQAFRALRPVVHRAVVEALERSGRW